MKFVCYGVSSLCVVVVDVTVCIVVVVVVGAVIVNVVIVYIRSGQSFSQLFVCLSSFPSDMVRDRHVQ